MLVAGRADTEPVVLTNDRTAHIVTPNDSAHLTVVLTFDPDVHTELGRISMC
jgi:hypothetical protein